MSKTLINLLATVFLTSSISAIAATTPDTNKDDAANLGTSDTPQIKQQQKRMEKNSMSNKSKNKSNSSMSNSSDQMMESNKKMDTNSDGMISKDEYMTHQEMTYGSMKQSDGGVNLDDMYSGKVEGAQTGGLEGKPVTGATRANTGNKY